MNRHRKLLLFLALALVGLLLSSSIPALAVGNLRQGKSLAEARKALEQELLPLAGAGFVGIANSEAEGEVVVFVEDEQARQKVPRSFEGYAVRTEVTGRIQAFSTQTAEPLAGVSGLRKQEVRPLVGGISLSAFIPTLYYSGTLGMVTYNDKILSNAHVIAMNPETAQFLPKGTTPILQRGSGDGGNLEDQVGVLENYIPIDFDPDAVNYADAAISSITVAAIPGEQFSEAGDYWIQGWTDVSAGNIVRKSGRSSGVTTGKVKYTSANVTVDYGDNHQAYFADLIVIEQSNWSFAQAGDSGSAVDMNGKFVGLVFAGSADRAVICKAEHIIDGLGIAVEPPPGEYSLTVSSAPGGSVTAPGEGMFVYDVGAVVDLLAVPDEHYHFVKWTGDVGSIADIYDASTTITMSGSYSISADFELDPGWCGLTVSASYGGNVTEPGQGTFVYPIGANVTLVTEADVANHYHFAEWTGDVSTIDDIYAANTTITMNFSYFITANFELDPGYYSLSISSTDGGSVTVPGEGVFVYGNGTVVNLVAVPDIGYQFLEWTGDVGAVADIYAALFQCYRCKL